VTVAPEHNTKHFPHHNSPLHADVTHVLVFLAGCRRCFTRVREGKTTRKAHRRIRPVDVLQSLSRRSYLELCVFNTPFILFFEILSSSGSQMGVGGPPGVREGPPGGTGDLF